MQPLPFIDDEFYMDKKSLTKELVEIANRYEEEKGTPLNHLNSIKAASRYVRDAFHMDKKLNKNSSILDLGCGLGHMSYLMANLGHNLAASDIFPEVPYYIQFHNARRIRPIDYLACNILDSGDNLLLDRKFSAVCLSGVLEHVPDFSEFLIRVRKLLSQDGFLFVFRFPNKSSWIERISDYKSKARGSHPIRFSRKEMNFILRWHGYKVVAMRYEQFLPVNTREMPVGLKRLYSKLDRIIVPSNDVLVRTPILNRFSTSLQATCLKARFKS